jgi:hypothetical protein
MLEFFLFSQRAFCYLFTKLSNFLSSNTENFLTKGGVIVLYLFYRQHVSATAIFRPTYKKHFKITIGYTFHASLFSSSDDLKYLICL